MNLEATPPSIASITGDFVLAFGPDRSDWLAALPGFQIAHDDGAGVRLAVSGPASMAIRRDGSGWVALADLIEGHLAEGDIAGRTAQRHWRGRFAQVAWDAAGITAFSDHFGSVPVYWCQAGEHIAVASSLRLLLHAPWCDARLDLEAVYHYLNFAYVPAPLTICRQIRKLEPGSRLHLSRDHAESHCYFVPEYPADLRGTDAQLAADLREQIVATVQDYRPANGSWGCFLSGGTDSSSVVTILARQRPDIRVRTCSIGFAEAGYDEQEYSRLAARRCNADAHFDTVDRMRATRLIEAIVDGFDQPFGNASAIPTLACAELGVSIGLTTMLAGDGGDEIFGGNQRYAKDRVMRAFHGLPGPARRAARGMGRALGGGGSFLLNRVHNFVERASLPNPDRFYTDDAFASEQYQTLLTPGFREEVGRDASLEFMRRVHARGGDAGELHRIMRLDLLMAIAQNDLVKVHGGCKAHGVTVRFPFLDPRLVDYTGRLPERHKLRGLDKRHLFKRAMADVLPREILRKPKQGFGLPIAVWLRHDPAMQSLARSVLLDERTRQRGWIQPACVEQLLEKHISGAWDYSAELWQLLMLELWLRRTIDGL